MKVTLIVDIGSTYTKITAVDLEKEEVVGRSHAPSTVATDMTTGLKEAYDKLLQQTDIGEREIEHRLACSSAAGGLRLIAGGLVPALTTEAAKRAALGAGAKVVGIYSYQLSPAESKQIEQAAPDIILLAGGTDGGDTDVILHNSKILRDSRLTCPVVVCGNKVAAEEAASCLGSNGRPVVVTANVLPELDRLDVEPCRSTIREIFMNRIVHGKGLDKAQALLGGVIMPTPLAVLDAAQLLAQGTPGEEGLGELIVVDIGGATTDVISMSEGAPSEAGVVVRGLPEPYAKRTVEGDLGIRYNAVNILELVGEKQLSEEANVWDDISLEGMDLGKAVEYLSDHIDAVPKNQEEFLLDISLARSAVRIALERHAGSIEPMYTPSGMVNIQRGKDLTRVKKVIGTGGIIAYGREPKWVLEAARYREEDATSLRPKNPEYFVDGEYILYAVGLLSKGAPEKALRIAKKNLGKV